MQWLNEPAIWQRTDDVLRVSVDPGTDFWRATGYGYIHDNGHVYGERLPGDLDVSVRLRCTFAHQYDQAGIMLRADEQTWLKTGVEFFEGRPRLSTVLTLGWSSWMVADLPTDLEEITLRMSRRGDAVEIRYAAGDSAAELAALVFLPPDCEVLAGIMCAAPEGSGFIVSFHDLRIAGREWGGPVAGQTASDWTGRPDGELAGDWDAGRPSDGSGDWAEPRAGEAAAGWRDGQAGGMPAEWADDQPAGVPAEWGAEPPGEVPDWADDPPGGRPRGWLEPQPSEPATGGAGEHSGDRLLDWAQPQANDAAADWDRLSGSLARTRGGDRAAELADEQPGPGGTGPGGTGPGGTHGSDRAADPVGKKRGTGSKEPASDRSGSPAGDQTGPVLPAATPAKPAPAARKRSTPKLPVPRKPAPAGTGAVADAADEWISLLTADPAEE